MKKIHWIALVVFSLMVGISTFYLINDFVREHSRDKIVVSEPSEGVPIEKAEVIVESPEAFAFESPPEELMAKSESIADEEDYEYIVGASGGYITIFYREEVNGDNIKEITENPVNSLSKDEQINLRQGIKIKNDLELMRVMEDYGS